MGRHGGNGCQGRGQVSGGRSFREGEGEGCMSSLRPAVTLGESLGAVSGRGCLRPPLNVPRCLAPPFLVRVRGLLAQVASCVGWMRRVPSPWYVLLACLT